MYCFSTLQFFEISELKLVSSILMFHPKKSLQKIRKIFLLRKLFSLRYSNFCTFVFSSLLSLLWSRVFKQKVKVWYWHLVNDEVLYIWKIFIAKNAAHKQQKLAPNPYLLLTNTAKYDQYIYETLLRIRYVEGELSEILIKI